MATNRKKYNMPNWKQFLETKKIYLEPKKEPVWVRLEREMRENAHIKPYNEKVGEWLKFLKDLKWHYHCEEKKKRIRLEKIAGPAWYCELSDGQKQVISEIPVAIYCDLLYRGTQRTARALGKLGLTIKLPKPQHWGALIDCKHDTGVFLWDYYTAYFKHPPSELQKKYDSNARLLISSMFFIDMQECIDSLNTLVGPVPPPPKPKPIKQKKGTKCNEKFGLYKEAMYVTRVNSPHFKKQSNEPPPPPPFDYELKPKSDESIEELLKDTSFLEIRRQRTKKEMVPKRECNFKFWEANVSMQEKVLRARAKVKPLPMPSIQQYHLGNVAYTAGRAHFIINNVLIQPLGCVIHRGNDVRLPTGEYVTHIINVCIVPIYDPRCSSSCDCLSKWGSQVMERVKMSKCDCGHFYDFKNESKPKEKVEKLFHSPTRYGSYWFDEAGIFKVDPLEDFVKANVQAALRSSTPTPESSMDGLDVSDLKFKELLAILLADLSMSGLITPHLPGANLIHILHEWCRRRVKGKYVSDKLHKARLRRMERMWLTLDQTDFKAKAYKIPLTRDQREHMTWAHRNMLHKLQSSLVDNFTTRNRQKQLELSRLFWATMQNEKYPGKNFEQVFFSYMAAQAKDVDVIRPYDSAANAMSYSPKCCPLDFHIGVIS